MADNRKYQPASLRNIGYRVTYRQISWLDMVVREWGDEWAQDDHGMYEWANGRSFDSTDKGTTGIYNGRQTVVLDSIILQNHYPDAPAHLVTQSGWKIRFQQSPRIVDALLDLELEPFVLGEDVLG